MDTMPAAAIEAPMHTEPAQAAALAYPQPTPQEQGMVSSARRETVALDKPSEGFPFTVGPKEDERLDAPPGRCWLFR